MRPGQGLANAKAMTPAATARPAAAQSRCRAPRRSARFHGKSGAIGRMISTAAIKGAKVRLK